MKDSPDDLVLCARFSDAPTAALAVSLLSDEEIPAVADNAMITTLLPFVGSVRVMVRRADLDRATAILRPGKLLE